MNDFVKAFLYALKNAVPLPEVFKGQKKIEQKITAAKVSGLAALKQAQAVFESFKKSGLSFGDFKAAVKDGAFYTGLQKAQRDAVIRNSLQVAYNKGRWAQQQAFLTITHLQYVTKGDDRVRPNHAAINRVILPKGDPFWAVNYPPNGFNCRCIAKGLTREQAGALGITPPDKIPAVMPDKGWEFNAGMNATGASLNSPIDEIAKQLYSLLGGRVLAFAEKIKGL